MPRPTTSMLVLSLTGVLALGSAACDRDRERRESTPGETRTRSGELTGESPRVDAPRLDIPRAEPPRTEPTRDDAAASDPRLDAGRLSIVGSAEDRERNLGLVTDAAAAPPLAPAPQQGAGAVENPPRPTYREGAGRPGAGGDPYQ